MTLYGLKHILAIFFMKPRCLILLRASLRDIRLKRALNALKSAPIKELKEALKRT